MGVDRKVFVEKFEPVVQPNEFVQTFPKIAFYKVRAIYGLPWLPINICDNTLGHLNAALAFGVQSRIFELQDLYFDDLELGQLRFIPREDWSLTWVGRPRATDFYSIKSSTFAVPTYYIDPRTNPANEYLHLNEVFQFEDTKFFAQATTFNPLGLAAANLDVFGYRFILEEVTLKNIPTGIKPTVLPTEGWSGAIVSSKVEPTAVIS